jgi:hypothetical protein
LIKLSTSKKPKKNQTALLHLPAPTLINLKIVIHKADKTAKAPKTPKLQAKTAVRTANHNQITNPAKIRAQLQTQDHKQIKARKIHRPAKLPHRDREKVPKENLNKLTVSRKIKPAHHQKALLKLTIA